MRITERISERLATTWKLLSDTDRFLAKTSLFSHYEGELREWRSGLQRHAENKEAVTLIRSQLIELRKTLRLAGYDLSLVDRDLLVSGYCDDSCASTHRRLVLVIGALSIGLIAGEANHESLSEHLRESIKEDILEIHNLWYRWEGPRLHLSGSDSEGKDDFELLKTWCESPENRHRLLRAMKARGYL